MIGCSLVPAVAFYNVYNVCLCCGVDDLLLQDALEELAEQEEEEEELEEVRHHSHSSLCAPFRNDACSCVDCQ